MAGLIAVRILGGVKTLLRRNRPIILTRHHPEGFEEWFPARGRERLHSLCASTWQDTERRRMIGMKTASVFAGNALPHRCLIIRDMAPELLNELNAVAARIEFARVGFCCLDDLCGFCLQNVLTGSSFPLEDLPDFQDCYP